MIPLNIDPYPLSAFPVIPRRAIEELAKNVQVPVELAAMSVLSAMATVCQRNTKVRAPYGGATKPLSLFILVRAESGAGKSAVDRLVYEPLQEFDQQREETYLEEMTRYQREHRIWAAREKKLLCQIVKCEAEDEELRAKLDAHQKAEPSRPRLRRLLWQNSSERAVVDAVIGVGASFTLHADEGGVILESPLFEKTGFVNKLWDGGPVVFDRANGYSHSGRDVRVSIVILIQPEIMDSFDKKKGSEFRAYGGYARFIPASPISMKGWRQIDPIHNSCYSFLKEFHQIIYDLLAEESTCDLVLEFDSDAKQLWVDFVNKLESDMAPGRCLSEVTDFASKVGENVTRIAAIFHRFSRLDGQISRDSVGRAIEVMCYHIGQFRLMFDKYASVPRSVSDASKLYEYIYRVCMENKITSIPRSDVLHSGPVRGKVFFDPALLVLCNQGFVWVGVDVNKKKYINLVQGFQNSNVGGACV